MEKNNVDRFFEVAPLAMFYYIHVYISAEIFHYISADNAVLYFCRRCFKIFLQALYGIASSRDRWRTCTSYAKSVNGKAVGRMFVERHFDERSKDEVCINTLIQYGVRWSVSVVLL